MADDTTTPANPLGDMIADMVDVSVTRRLTAVRRAYVNLRKEVTELRARPQVDPMALLTGAIGAAAAKLQTLDAKAVEAIEAEMKPTETT